MEKMPGSCQFECRERDMRIILTWILGKQAYETGSGSCPMIGSDISDDGPSGSTMTVLVQLVNQNFAVNFNDRRQRTMQFNIRP